MRSNLWEALAVVAAFTLLVWTLLWVVDWWKRGGK